MNLSRLVKEQKLTKGQICGSGWVKRPWTGPPLEYPDSTFMKGKFTELTVELQPGAQALSSKTDINSRGLNGRAEHCSWRSLPLDIASLLALGKTREDCCHSNTDYIHICAHDLHGHIHIVADCHISVTEKTWNTIGAKDLEIIKIDLQQSNKLFLLTVRYETLTGRSQRKVLFAPFYPNELHDWLCRTPNHFKLKIYYVLKFTATVVNTSFTGRCSFFCPISSPNLVNGKFLPASQFHPSYNKQGIVKANTCLLWDTWTQPTTSFELLQMAVAAHAILIMCFSVASPGSTVYLKVYVVMF